MSSFPSHRSGINISQYIANLNTIEPIELSDSSKSGDDLSLFTNTHFFDFDMGRSTDAGVSAGDICFDLEHSPKSEQQHQQRQRRSQQQIHQHHQQLDVSPSSQNTASPTAANTPVAPTSEFDFLAPSYIDYELPIIPTASGVAASSAETRREMTYGQQVIHPSGIHFPATPAGSSVTGLAPTPPSRGNSTPSLKRSSSTATLSQDEQSRIAAEEDKRRRNTAASARFRIKKKQREQQMEQTAKELQDKVQQLEAKVLQLEMENKWLKNIVVEKNEVKATTQILTSRPSSAIEEQAEEGTAKSSSKTVKQETSE
ncbi:uncharacterized protein V1516DRAFT_672840 [Lipomyces oligophaga]|uniref:uncharacterized protein n=1 Tax=Lipomyces oligophaga TaxID=45792 RepID=UPI0034CD48D5